MANIADLGLKIQPDENGEREPVDLGKFDWSGAEDVATGQLPEAVRQIQELVERITSNLSPVQEIVWRFSDIHYPRPLDMLGEDFRGTIAQVNETLARITEPMTGLDVMSRVNASVRRDQEIHNMMERMMPPAPSAYQAQKPLYDVSSQAYEFPEHLVQRHLPRREAVTIHVVVTKEEDIKPLDRFYFDEAMNSRLEGAKQIAHAVGRSEATVRRWAKNPDAPIHKIGGRLIAFRNDLLEWIQSN